MRYCIMILCIVVLSSCFARGGVIGEERVNLDVTLAELHVAITTVLRVEKIVIEEDAVDASSSLVKARYADKVPVTFHAKKLTEKASVLTIQVGAFGNKMKASDLLEKIKARIAAAEIKAQK